MDGFPNKVNSTTGTIYWPHQALEPIYIWNNTGGLFRVGRYLPIATTAVEEWWPIGTIIHPPVGSKLLQPVRLMDHLARAGEPWPIARPPARLESPTLQPIRDRGTPALQIPMECSKMGRTGFCINALRQTLDALLHALHLPASVADWGFEPFAHATPKCLP